MKPHTVFLIDDHPVLLSGLSTIIASEPGFRVIGSTTESISALEQIKFLKPDIVIMDIHMPKLGGIALLRQINYTELPIHTIFLTATITPTQASEAINYGIEGILLKEAKPSEVIDCLRSIAGGRRWLAEEVNAKLAFARSQALIYRQSALTPREEEIMEFLCLGLSNKVIAQNIGSTEGTVKVHIHNIFRKMGVSNRTALVSIFFEGLYNSDRVTKEMENQLINNI